MSRGARKRRRSCHANSKNSRSKVNDRLSELPDEIILSIMSEGSFTLKEAAKTSVLSKRWKKLWLYYHKLKLEDSRTMENIGSNNCNGQLVYKERSKFIKWVNYVVEQHLGSAFDEFRVVFYLDYSCQCEVDKWMDFALTKRIERLELYFEHPGLRSSVPEHYMFPLERYMRPELSQSLAGFKGALTSLCLKCVDISTEAVEWFLHFCPNLENLSIDGSKYLTSIRASTASLRLKHLNVGWCFKLEAIDISAPHLMSFKYFGRHTELRIRNASSLCDVSIAATQNVPITFAFDSLCKYFPQLEYLKLQSCFYKKINLGIYHTPTLKNLKHLKLSTLGCEPLVLGWIPLIQASPVLQKLTLLFTGWEIYEDFPDHGLLKSHRQHPLKCLKILEIIKFESCCRDHELVAYVLGNAIVLEEVILRVESKQESVLKRAMEVEGELPQGAKLHLHAM